MKNTTDYKKEMSEIADALEEIRNAFGVIGISHNRCLAIPDIEKGMLIECALAVVGSAFEKIDNIHSWHNN